MLSTASVSDLDALNPEQRRAVEHGVSLDGHVGAPLLVIAGAGSGKTNTLAHRVAHLIVSGADPRRILLMTFSRRAAAEMAKRVERIARKVLGANAGVMTDALTWAGTFHGIGARLLREHADQIGIDPAFTIHDREDSADVMNLVRHDRNASEAVQDGRIFIELINAPFLNAGGTPAEYRAGVDRAIAKGWVMAVRPGSM